MTTSIRPPSRGRRRRSWPWRSMLAALAAHGVFSAFGANVAAADLTVAWEPVSNPYTVEKTRSGESGQARVWFYEGSRICRFQYAVSVGSDAWRHFFDKWRHYRFDPSDNTWTPVPNSPIMDLWRASYDYQFTMSALSDGGVVHRYGHEDGRPAPMAMLDPMGTGWTAIADAPSIAERPWMIQDPYGGVWLIDRYADDYGAGGHAWRYHPETDTWTGHDHTLTTSAMFGYTLPNSHKVHHYASMHPYLWLLDTATLQQRRLTEKHGLWDIHSGAWADGQPLLLFRLGFSNPVETCVAAVSLNGSLTVMEPMTAAADRPHEVFSLRLSGGDYAGYVCHPDGQTTLLRVFDPATDTWVDLTTNPLPGSTIACVLPDGLLFSKADLATGFQQFQRLRVQENNPQPNPARIADRLPDRLTLMEDETARLEWTVIGEVPAGGVDVLIERVAGDGDIRVVAASEVHVVDAYSGGGWAHIAGLKDADGDADQGMIRFSVLQPGGAPDPHARMVEVLVEDRYQGRATHLAGDVTCDGVVNALDLDEVVDAFGSTGDGQ